LDSHNTNSEMSAMDDETFFQAILELLTHKPVDASLPKRSHADQVREILFECLPKPAKEMPEARVILCECTLKPAKEMPEVLQGMIQEFARPVTRGDWRTAKEDEAWVIRQLHDDKQQQAVDFIGGIEFWDIIIGQTFYELLKNYPAGEGTIQLRRHWG
jgi:hypothetical protein